MEQKTKKMPKWQLKGLVLVVEGLGNYGGQVQRHFVFV
jgi:hypothetical protein